MFVICSILRRIEVLARITEIATLGRRRRVDFVRSGAVGAMNVSLTGELESLFHVKVGTGRYGSGSAVSRAALREKISAGVATLRAGKGADGEALLGAIDAEVAQIGQQLR